MVFFSSFRSCFIYWVRFVFVSFKRCPAGGHVTGWSPERVALRLRVTRTNTQTGSPPGDLRRLKAEVKRWPESPLNSFKSATSPTALRPRWSSDEGGAKSGEEEENGMRFYWQMLRLTEMKRVRSSSVGCTCEPVGAPTAHPPPHPQPPPPPAPYSLMSSSATGQKLLQVKHESRRRRRRGGGWAQKKLGVCLERKKPGGEGGGAASCCVRRLGEWREPTIFLFTSSSSSFPQVLPVLMRPFFRKPCKRSFIYLFFCALSSQSRCVSSKVLPPGLHWYTNDALKINLAPIHRVGGWP